MASSKYASSHSDVRKEFKTKEGVYRIIKGSEHCRPSKQPLFGKELTQVQVSFVSCKDKDGLHEWVLFNSGKELYFYPFEGVGKVPDLRKPLDKRVYKTPTVPVCHDFNLLTRSTSKLDLIVGFSTGPLQYLNPIAKQAICAFNEDGSIDSTRVTCVKWVPGSENTFVSSHRSGNLYVWSTENTSKTTGQQNYSPHKVIQDATIHTVKPKNKASVIYRWAVGHGAINSFSFSPDLTHIAIASQDGFLRVYDFHKQELYGRMRSYFGGLLSVCWSPDGRYAVTGGEDDLVNVWSFEHRKVVARGEGHKSYVSVVAFDPYTTVIPDTGFSASSRLSVCSSEDGTSTTPGAQASVGAPKASIDPSSAASSPYLGRLASESAADLDRVTVAYRLGSIGQDTQLCLWDLSGDALKLRRQFSRSRSRMSRQASRPVSTGDVLASSPAEGRTGEEKQKSAVPQESSEHHRLSQPDESVSKSVLGNHVSSSQGASTDSPQTTDKAPEQSLSSKPENDSLSEGKESSPSVASEHSSEKSSEKGSGKKEKKSKKDKEKDKEKEKEKTKDEEHSKRKNTNKTVKLMTEPVRKVMRFVGGGVGHAYRREVRTFETCNSDDIASKMYEVNLIEPLVAKKISQERLTALVFREDCIVTACQEGFVQTWARPSTVLPAEATAEDAASKHTTSAASSHPGLNSPRPGCGPDPAPVKHTTV